MEMNSPEPMKFRHEQTEIRFRDDMPDPQVVEALALVESNPDKRANQHEDGSFNPSAPIRNEVNRDGSEREIISTGRFQLGSHVIKELLDKGMGDDLFTVQERRLLKTGNFEEQKGVMIARAEQVDKLALRRLAKDTQRLSFNNPIVDGHYWQAPARTIRAVNVVTKGESWDTFQGKYGKKGAALLLMNEIAKDAPKSIKDRIVKYQDNIDALAGDKPDMSRLDPYTQRIMTEMYGMAPVSEEENLQTAQTTVANTQEVVQLAQTMEESDDPGILMAGLDWTLDMLAIPSDKTRAFVSHHLGMDVSPEAMEKGRVTSREFIDAVAPEAKKFMDLESLPDWDDNKPFMENVLNTIQTVNENVASTMTEVGVDLLTDPLAYLNAGFTTVAKAAKTAQATLQGVARTRATKAVMADMAKTKAETAKVAKAEAIVAQANTSLKSSQQVAMEKVGLTMRTGTDTVNDVNNASKHIANDVMATIKARELELASGMGRTIAQANKEAVEEIAQTTLGTTVANARKLFPNAPVNDTQFAIWAKTNAEVTFQLVETARAVVKARAMGPTEEAAKLQTKAMELYEAHRQVVMANESGLSAAARTMRFSQEPTEHGANFLKMDKLDARLEKEMMKAGNDPALFLEGLAAIKDPLKIAKVTQKLEKGFTFFGGYRELLVNELLSGPATHVLNITTGVSSLTYGGLQRTLGALTTNPLGRNVEKADVRDAANYWMGAMGALPEAMTAIAKMPFDQKKALNALMASDENKLAITKSKRAISGGEAQPDDSPAMSFMRMVGNGVGSVVNTPITALMATDRGMRHVIANAELRFLASQMADAKLATQKGLTAAEQAKTRKDFIRDVVHNPDKFNPLLKDALDHADDGIFTSRLKGFQAKLEEARADSRVAQLVVPFYKAIMNIGNYEVRRIPGIQFASKDFRAQLSSSDPLVRQQAHGNLAIGAVMTTVGYQMADSGTIIGKAPTDAKQAAMMKDLGIEPYSMVFDTDDDGVPDKWVSYKNWGPFGTMLGTMANLHQIRGYAKEEWPEAVGHSLVGVTELILDKTIAENFHSMMETMFKFMDQPEKLSEAMSRQMVTYSLLNPKITEYMQRSLDPVIRSKSGFVEQLQARTPYWNAGLPAERNILGDDIYMGFLDPDETNVLSRSMLGFLGTTASGKHLNDAQELAVEIMQPLLDQGITVSKPEREIGELTLNKAQTDFQRDAFYKGNGVLQTTLLEDLNSAYEDWLGYTAQLDLNEVQTKLLEGGLTPEQVHNLEPNKVLQQLVNRAVDKRKQATMKALIHTFGDEIGDRILAEQMKERLIKDRPRNNVATSPGGRKIDDLIRKREPSEVDPVETILDTPRRVQERLDFSIGGQ